MPEARAGDAVTKRVRWWVGYKLSRLGFHCIHLGTFVRHGRGNWVDD